MYLEGEWEEGLLYVLIAYVFLFPFFKFNFITDTEYTMRIHFTKNPYIHIYMYVYAILKTAYISRSAGFFRPRTKVYARKIVSELR